VTLSFAETYVLHYSFKPMPNLNHKNQFKTHAELNFRSELGLSNLSISITLLFALITKFSFNSI